MEILIDLDNTILDFDLAEEQALDTVLTDLALPVNDQYRNVYYQINRSLWQDLEKGHTTVDRLKVERFARFLQEINHDSDPSQIATNYAAYLSQGYDLIEGAEHLLNELSKYAKLYIASNGISNIQRPRIKGAQLDAYFADIFLSEEIGFAKPDPRFFEACFQSMQCQEPQKMMMIGDSLTSDIQGGLNVGLTTVWFNRHGVPSSTQIVPNYTVASLAEIPAIIQQIQKTN